MSQSEQAIIVAHEVHVEKTKQQQNVHGDYQEFATLILQFLGELPGSYFRAPSTFHHAWWMAKALFTIKVWTFHDQFQLTAVNEHGLNMLLCSFIYLEAWIKVTNVFDTQAYDISLLKSIQGYKKVHNKVAQTAWAALNCHLVCWLSPPVSISAWRRKGTWCS